MQPRAGIHFLFRVADGIPGVGSKVGELANEFGRMSVYTDRSARGRIGKTSSVDLVTVHFVAASGESLTTVYDHGSQSISLYSAEAQMDIAY
ncbi:MAG: hypothetical protein AAGA95_11635, partial [Pseudomonadota bacterium]